MIRFTTFLIFFFAVITLNETMDDRLINDKPYSVIEIKNQTGLLRGIPNKLKIAVQNCKSFKVYAKGLETTKRPGEYIINITRNPSKFTNIKLEIITRSNDTIFEERIFKNLDIGRPEGLINGIGCSKCIVKLTKEEFKSGVIGMKAKNISLSENVRIMGYSIKLPNKEALDFEGDTINKRIADAIDNLTQGEIVQIFNIKVVILGMNYKLKKVSTISVMISEDA